MAYNAKDELETGGRWLLAMPTEEAKLLQHTREYQDFLRALEGLHKVHRRVARWRRHRMLDDEDVDLRDFGTEAGFSFVQDAAADEVILKVMEFLDAQTLVRSAKTCIRFRDLARKSARERTRDVANERQVNNVMELLRAKEQLDGTAAEDVLHGPYSVRIPMLLLPRRVLITNTGDTEYNGIYYCTGTNGNGYVFTKPRYPLIRARVPAVRRVSDLNPPDNDDPIDTLRGESEVAQPGQYLRCIIAKRFSSETLLWYCSKEVATDVDGHITQEFSFWAKLMVIGDASPDICRYPSQTSILMRHEAGWQTLRTIGPTDPPVVELL